MRWRFKKWKQLGKPSSASSEARLLYIEARAELQRLRRRDENFQCIRHNNKIMGMYSNERSKIFTYLKSKTTSRSTFTRVLHTPIGTYYEDDVLGGIAVDT